MRRLGILALLAVAIFSRPSFAASACVSDSLAGYVALGVSGCMIGSNTLSGFEVLVGTNGAVPIDPASISLSPTGNATNPGLTTTVNVSASGGTVREAFFSYVISGNSYSGSSIGLAGSSQSGDGAVTGIKDFCLDGTFGQGGISFCSGTPGSLTVLNGVQNSDATTFGSAGFIAVADDLIVDSGLTGSASAGTLTNRFSTTAAVPEPGSVCLVTGGFFVAMAIRRRRLHRMYF